MMGQLLSRACHLAGAALVATASCVPCPAHALTPPSIDPSRLPAPAVAAPPRPSAQRSPCVVAEAAARPGATDPLAGLNLAAVWPLTRGAGQRVAVIDTGVNRHTRLTRVDAGGDYVGTGDGTQDCDGHGTVVAGIIAAAPDPADPGHFSGVAPEATVLSIRQSSTVFGPADDPSVVGFGDVDTMAAAVRTAADAGATVLNISSVACAQGALHDGPLGAALAYAVDTRDVVVVAAAGNAGGPNQCPRQSPAPKLNWADATVAVSPAWYDDYVLTVGSVDADGTASPFSLAGPWVDVAAPGEQMISLNPAGQGLTDTLPTPAGSGPISGTSYAAPVVTGLAALVRARFPALTARQVMQRIEDTAHHRPGGWDPVVGNGVVDPGAALGLSTPEAGVAPARTVDDARGTALIGAAGCGGVLALVLATMSVAGRSRQDQTGPEREDRQDRADGQ